MWRSPQRATTQAKVQWTGIREFHPTVKPEAMWIGFWLFLPAVNTPMTVASSNLRACLIFQALGSTRVAGPGEGGMDMGRMGSDHDNGRERPCSRWARRHCASHNALGGSNWNVLAHSKSCLQFSRDWFC